MRFALLGNHPDGLLMARALVGSGRHELAAYAGPKTGADQLKQAGITCQTVGDVEEILADPQVLAVIVAGKLADRPAQLRRALQSERHVLCIHPADKSPDIAYEAAMIQADTKQVLFPLLPESLHPAIRRLAELLRARQPGQGMIELIVESPGEFLAGEAADPRPALPGWAVLRALAGEVAEVSAFAEQEQVSPGMPLVLAGKFEQGGLFRSTYLPARPQPLWRLSSMGTFRAELVFPEGLAGPARLNWPGETGTGQEETWDAWDPWPALVAAFEAQVARGPAARQPAPPPPIWQDAIRSLELDDAVRRSIKYRRCTTLEYQEASEEVGFKGTMTLVGCGLLWLLLLLVILSNWFPYLGWLIIPILAIFILMQMLRWIIPRKDA